MSSAWALSESLPSGRLVYGTGHAAAQALPGHCRQGSAPLCFGASRDAAPSDLQKVLVPACQLTGHASLRVLLCRQSEVGDVVTNTIARVFGNNFKVRSSCCCTLCARKTNA